MVNVHELWDWLINIGRVRPTVSLCGRKVMDWGTLGYLSTLLVCMFFLSEKLEKTSLESHKLPSMLIIQTWIGKFWVIYWHRPTYLIHHRLSLDFWVGGNLVTVPHREGEWWISKSRYVWESKSSLFFKMERENPFNLSIFSFLKNKLLYTQTQSREDELRISRGEES